MKTLLILGSALLLAQDLFAQGTVAFINRGGTSTTAAPGQVLAPVYSRDPDPRVRISGNTTNGIPAGDTSYGSAGFLHAGSPNTWIATLWALESTQVTGNAEGNNLQLLAVNGSATFRTSTSGTFAGVWNPPFGAAVVPGVSNANQRATFQVRVWDTQGGTITTWAQLYDPANNAVLRGYSILFTVPWPLGGTMNPSNPPPFLQSLESFNVHVIGGASRPKILTQPTSQLVPAGANATFSVMAEGTAPIYYQWRFNGSNLTDATGSVLTISNAQLENSGDYTVVITNFVGSVTSSVANLTVGYALTLNITGMGTVDRNPMQNLFLPNSTVTLTATPASGYRFAFWSGDASGRANPLNITMNSHKVVTVSFLSNSEPAYVLSTSTAGGGVINSSPTNQILQSNTVVTLTATPQSGWSLLGWLGDAQGTNPTVTLLMDRDRCAEAIFGTPLRTTVSGNGTITLDPSAPLYPYGWSVSLTAIPNLDAAFGVWGDAGQGTNNPLLLKVTNANANVSALFSDLLAEEFSLAVRALGRGHVTIVPQANRYARGQTVTLSAVPDIHQEFLGWTYQTNEGTETQNPLSVMISSNTFITATFTRKPTLAIWNCGDREPGDPLRVIISGELGDRFGIESSPDLLSWSPEREATNNFGRLQFDLPLTNNVNQFIRARLQD